MIRILLATLLIVSCSAINLRDTTQLKDLFRITTIDTEPQINQINNDSGEKLNSFDECMQGLQHALTPNGVDVLGQMLLNSGKFVNQYGDPEACRDNPNTNYKIKGIPIAIEMGICAPAGCDSQQVYDGLTQYANQKLEEMGVKGITLTVLLPYSDTDHTLSVGAIIVICLTSLILLLGIIGTIIEYFPFFEKVDSLPTDKVENRKTKLGLLFFSFSLKNNIQKLFEVNERGDSNLKILNGIRVFSIGWVIVGHVYMTIIGFPASNIITGLSITTDWYFALIPGGFYAVDVFFFMSGLLTFYLLTIKMYPKKGCENYFMLYFHRWFRLFTPALYCMLLCVFIFKYFGSGPRYFDSWNMGCSKNWWSSMLFINNLHPWEEGEMCMGWYWYLSNDFEFFLISPIIIVIYCLNRYAGYGALTFCFLFNYIFNMVVTAKFNFGIFSTLSDTENFMFWLYLKPWSRFATYGVGALFGWAYFEYTSKDKYPQFQDSIWARMFAKYRASAIFSYASAAIGLFLTTFLIFIQHDFYKKNQIAYNNWDKVPCMLFNAFARTGFILGLVLIVLPTFEGRLPWIKTLLGSDFMCVLGRLTFGVYLMNIPWIMVFLADLRQSLWIDNVNGWFLSFATTLISFLFAIPFTLICEVPFMNLEKYFLMPHSKDKKHVKQNEGVNALEKDLEFTKESDEKETLLSRKYKD